MNLFNKNKKGLKNLFSKKIIFGGIIILALILSVMSAIAAVPTVTLNSPADNAVDIDGNVTFAYTLNNGASVCELYTNISGTWQSTGTPNTSPNNGINTFDVNSIADNTEFIWNVKCTNLDGSAFASANRTLTIDINDAPVWITHIDNQPSIQEDSGETNLFDVDSYVIDLDNDTLTFTVQTEDTSKVDCSIDSTGKNLKIKPAANYYGTTSCTIRASDGSLYADDTFSITVANVQDAPDFKTPVPDQTMVAGTSKNINLNDYAEDVDGDSLSYSATSSDTSKATAELSGNTLTISALANVTGTATVDVTASDGAEQAQDSFVVTIRAAETKLSLPSSLKLGSSSQDRGEYVNGNFEISNTGVEGDTTLTNLKVTFDKISSYDGNVTFSTSSSGTYTQDLTLSNLSYGEKTTVYVKAFIPEDAYGGVFNAGKIQIASAEKTSSFNLNLETALKLKFADLDISVDEGDDSNIEDEDSGYEIDKDAAPGTDIEIAFKLENTYTDSEDIEIKDIEAEFILEDMGDEGEQDETVEVENLNADEKSESYTVTFKVPYQVAEGKYDLEMNIEGIDDNDAKHKFSKTFKINVAKESHQIALKADLIPDTVSCQKSSDLEIEVFNIGDKDENDIDVEVTSTKLGIDLSQAIDKLDNKWDANDNNEKLSFTLDIPEETAPGNYPVKIEVYRDNKDKKELSASYTLKIEKCSTGTVTSTDEEEITVIDKTETAEPVADTKIDITDSLETPFTETTAFMVLLIIGIIAVIALIVLMLFIAFRK